MSVQLSASGPLSNRENTGLKRGGIPLLGSPRIRRAPEAIAVAESVQSECSRSAQYRAVIEEEQPERLTPMGATLKQVERAVSRTLRERSFYGLCQDDLVR
jgi:hypothetical protein